jgi:hypothetical protein
LQIITRSTNTAVLEQLVPSFVESLLQLLPIQEPGSEEILALRVESESFIIYPLRIVYPSPSLHLPDDPSVVSIREAYQRHKLHLDFSRLS